MDTTNLLQLSPRANARAKVLISGEKTLARLGFRFKSNGVKSEFYPLDVLQTGDLVIQPVLNGAVVFVDQKTAALPISVSIDVDDDNQWTYACTERKITPKPEKITKKKTSRKKVDTDEKPKDETIKVGKTKKKTTAKTNDQKTVETAKKTRSTKKASKL